MTSHQFAKQLLEMPDLPIIHPPILGYDMDAAEHTSHQPTATIHNGTNSDETPQQVILISFKR